MFVMKKYLKKTFMFVQWKKEKKGNYASRFTSYPKIPFIFYIFIPHKTHKTWVFVTTASLIVKKGSIYRPREREGKKYVIRK